MTELSAEFRARLKDDLWHRLRPMTGRDPLEKHRVATPLELLYDLVYVIAFGVAASQLAHLLSEGAVIPALGAYLFAIFGVSWAWMNFTWFASAYGNDDALFRVSTIIQMVGVVIFIFGLPLSFEAAAHDKSANNLLLVIGYVVMRVPLIALWLRAAREDPERRRTAVAYAVTIAIAQVGWLLSAILPLPTVVVSALLVVLALAEMIAPVVIERRLGAAPWNPGHIAERFALLTLITLGEVVTSTTLAVGALIEAQGMSPAAAVIAAAGIVLAAALWWAYFLIPSRTLLQHWPTRIWAWRYAHLPMFGAIAAGGAGLHVAALAVEHDHGSLIMIALSIAIPVAAVILMVYLTWSLLVKSFDWAHVPMLLLCLMPLIAAVVVAAVSGDTVHLAIGTLVTVIALIALSSIVEVIVHERVGYSHTINALEKAA